MNEYDFGIGILGMGSSLPSKVLTNFDLEKMVDTTDEWIKKRTGISERRVLEENEPAFELGILAANKALKDANVKASEVDLIIVTTETPDYLTPSSACIIQNRIGAINAAAFDINAACSGLIYGMTIAEQFIKTDYYKKILIVGVEGLTKIVDWKDRNTCILFGDGSGAVLVGKVEKGYGILASDIGAAGELGHHITIPCCYISEEDKAKRINKKERSIWMDGSEVFKFAVRIMDEATKRVLNKAGITLDDVKLIVPHQANIRIIDGAARRMKISKDKVFSNIDKFANISSASIPVGLDQSFRDKRIKRGDYIVLVGFGGGLTWGSILLKWNKEEEK